MSTRTITKLLAFLAIPVAALTKQGVIFPKRFTTVPFAPATPEQGTFRRCSIAEHHEGNLAHAAGMLDCLDIGTWAKSNDGMWILDATTTDGNNSDWHALHVQGTCALVVKNNESTSIGNKDVADFIEDIHMGDGIRLGSVEEVGTFCGCPDGVDVSFWLRSSGF